MSQIFFYSDPHFYHKRVIGYCLRPFNSLDHMHQELIDRYNSVVTPRDTCYWLGDCFFSKSTKDGRSILDQLNGRKILIRGNHDFTKHKMVNMGFCAVLDSMWMNIANHPVQLKHYPFYPAKFKLQMSKWRLRLINRHEDLRYKERRPKPKGQILIHGHTHQDYTFDKKRRMIHVGVDSNDFTPVHFTFIENWIIDNFKPGKLPDRGIF